MMKPKFMENFEEFDRERKRVKSVEDWIQLGRRWFDREKWPEKTPQQRAAESIRNRGPVVIGGRVWNYMMWTYDLTPEARYEYFWTLKTIGDAVRFPESRELPKRAELGFSQLCPFCCVTTSDIGEETCPRCGRELLYSRSTE